MLCLAWSRHCRLASCRCCRQRQRRTWDNGLEHSLLGPKPLALVAKGTQASPPRYPKPDQDQREHLGGLPVRWRSSSSRPGHSLERAATNARPRVTTQRRLSRQDVSGALPDRNPSPIPHGHALCMHRQPNGCSPQAQPCMTALCMRGVRTWVRGPFTSQEFTRSPARARARLCPWLRAHSDVDRARAPSSTC